MYWFVLPFFCQVDLEEQGKHDMLKTIGLPYKRTKALFSDEELGAAVCQKRIAHSVSRMHIAIKMKFCCCSIARI